MLLLITIYSLTSRGKFAVRRAMFVKVFAVTFSDDATPVVREHLLDLSPRYFKRISSQLNDAARQIICTAICITFRLGSKIKCQ